MRIKEFEQNFQNYVPGLQGAQTAYAVLVPLVMHKGEAHLLFEVRADTLKRQPGEVCFPGGRMEQGESAIQCALRETEEELSLPRNAIRPIAELDFIYHQTGYLIHPILGEIKEKALQKMQKNDAEVKETFLVPFSFFLQNAPRCYSYALEPRPPEDFPYHLIGFDHPYPWRGGNMDVPIYLYENHAIWGLTGRICMNLAQKMQQKSPKTTETYQHITHPFAPLFDQDSNVLILGSFPSVKSREGQFFYHHPRNRFWKVIATLTGEAVPETIAQKQALLRSHHIALWDVIQSCDIIASSDSSIKNVTANDLRPILAQANIQQIYTNGATAGTLYQKHIASSLGQPCTILPSTSPANASYTLDKLVQRWGAAIPGQLLEK